MIGVDTNVLLRLFVNDDEAQHKAAKGFFAKRTSGEPAFVSMIVVVEVTWALTKRYGYSQNELLDLLDALGSSPDFVVENTHLLERAIEQCRTARGRLTDVLVALVAESSGCSSTVTFDRDAAKGIHGMELLR